jgi:ATP-dependent DNA ligase
VRSCLIDGEVVCCDERGVAAFHVLRHRRNEERLPLCLRPVELNGTDLRREPIETRKAKRASRLSLRHSVQPASVSPGRRGLPSRLQDGP